MTKRQHRLADMLQEIGADEGVADFQRALRDLLTDLRHVAAAHGLDVDQAAAGSAAVMREELAEQGDGYPPPPGLVRREGVDPDGGCGSPSCRECYEPVSDEHVMRENETFAQRLIDAGDVDSFAAAYGTRDINFRVGDLSPDLLREVYREYIAEE